MTEPRVNRLRLAACIDLLQSEPLRREASLDLALDLRDARQHIVELERVLDGYAMECMKVDQALGKALGYPWYCHDKQNFPDATEADGVCTGEHTAGTIATEAAARIEELEAENARLAMPTEREAKRD